MYFLVFFIPKCLILAEILEEEEFSLRAFGTKSLIIQGFFSKDEITLHACLLTNFLLSGFVRFSSNFEILLPLSGAPKPCAVDV